MAADSLGRGTIELVADARAFRATMAEAKKSISDLGKGQADASSRSSRSIDNYIAKLQLQNATIGKSAREAKVFELAARGATDSQLRAADAALKVREAHEKAQRSARGFSLQQLGIGISALATVTSLAKLSDEYTKYTAQLRLAVVGESELAQAQEDVRRIANGAQADLAATGTLYARIATAARDLGLGQQVAADLTESVTLALKVGGATAAESSSAILQLGQAFASGALRGEEFNSVNEAAPRLMRALADGLGVPVGALKEMASEGRLTADVLARELPKALNDLRREAGSINTIAGATTVLRNRFLELIGTSSETGGAVRGVVGAIEGLADNLHLLAVPIQAIIVLGGNLRYVFNTMGIAAAGVQEQLAGFQRGGVKGFLEARKLVSDILEEERKKFDAWEASVMSAGRAAEQFASDADDAALGGAMRALGARRATAAAPGRAGARADDGGADRLARAQQQARLDEIRRGSDAEIAEYARAGRLLEARRAADLIDERQTVELRKALITLNLQAQERGLQAEIDILKRRTFAGKDAAAEQIENAGRIADLEARLARAREEAATDAEALSIAERGRLKATARTIAEARIETDAYIGSIQRRNALELASVGRGSRAREESSGLADIEARFADRRRELQGERRRDQIDEPTFDAYLQEATRAYRAEVQAYLERSIEMRRLEGDWRNGAREALANYADDVRNVAKTFEDVFGNAIRRTEDDLTRFFDSGKLDAKGFADAIRSDLNRAFVRERITGPLAEGLKSGNLVSGLGGIFGNVLGAITGAPTQAAAPVEDRNVAAIISGQSIAKVAGAGVDGAAFTGAVTAAGTTFSASTIAAGTSLSATLTAAGASLATTITAAGAQFAATVGAAGGGGGGGLADIASLALDSFATGTPYVPKTGLYQLHKGEAVLTAAENARGGAVGRSTVISPTININAPGGVDRRTADHLASEIARRIQTVTTRGNA